MGVLAVAVSLASLTLAAVAAWYARTQAKSAAEQAGAASAAASAAEQHAHLAREQLAIDHERNERERDRDRRQTQRERDAAAPDLSIEIVGGYGGGSDGWRCNTSVHNSGGGVAHRVRVEAVRAGERVGGSGRATDIPPSESRDFTVTVASPHLQQAGGTQALEQGLTLTATDETGEYAASLPVR